MNRADAEAIASKWIERHGNYDQFEFESVVKAVLAGQITRDLKSSPYRSCEFPDCDVEFIPRVYGVPYFCPDHEADEGAEN